MKINPESFVVDEGLFLNYKSFFISGNDESYIFSLKDLLVKSFTKEGFEKKILTNKIDLNRDLFQIQKKHIYVCETNIDESLIEEVEKNEDALIYYEKSSTKNKLAKKKFSNSKDRALLECYKLDKNKKKNIFNGFIKKHSLVLEKNIYWLLLDILDNNFAILKNELEKLLLLDNKNDILSIENAFNINQSTDANKFFFKIHLSKSDITSVLNSSINSLSDFYSYFSYFKIYSLLLLDSKNIKDLEVRIPIYLFKEKNSFLNLFKSLNENKKSLLSLLIFKTERLVRTNPNLYKSLFFRFVLNYKKIIS